MIYCGSKKHHNRSKKDNYRNITRQSNEKILIVIGAILIALIVSWQAWLHIKATKQSPTFNGWLFSITLFLLFHDLIN